MGFRCKDHVWCWYLVLAMFSHLAVLPVSDCQFVNYEEVLIST